MNAQGGKSKTDTTVVVASTSKQIRPRPAISFKRQGVALVATASAAETNGIYDISFYKDEYLFLWSFCTFSFNALKEGINFGAAVPDAAGLFLDCSGRS